MTVIDPREGAEQRLTDLGARMSRLEVSLRRLRAIAESLPRAESKRARLIEVIDEGLLNF